MNYSGIWIICRGGKASDQNEAHVRFIRSCTKNLYINVHMGYYFKKENCTAGHKIEIKLDPHPAQTYTLECFEWKEYTR